MFKKSFFLSIFIIALVQRAYGECVNETFGTVTNGEKAYSGCPEGYDGFRSVVCNADGTFGEEDLSHCVLREATVFSYGVSEVTYFVGKQITPLFLRANGPISAYAITPALPSGLVLNTETGEISGTPLADASTTTYTVEGVNGERRKTTTLIITVANVMCSALDSFPATLSGEIATSSSACPVNYEGIARRNCVNGVFGDLDTTDCSLKAPSGLSYAPNSVTVKRNEPVTVMTPTVSNVVTEWTIDPALPTGMSLTNKGAIVGVPSIVRSAMTYTITARNQRASTTATVTITVDAASCTGMVDMNGQPVTVVNGGKLDSPCLDGYDGTAARTCNDGVYSEIDYATCIAKKPTGLAYSVSTYSLTQNEVLSTGRPLYGNIITAFSVSPSLPEGLSLDETTGIISGTATTLAPSQVYTITGSNKDASEATTITLEVVLPSCQGTAEFASVAVGESSTYDCSREKYSGKMTRKCVLVNGKAQWEAPDTYCQKDPNYTVLIIGIVVLVICIILLIVALTRSGKSKGSKAKKTAK